MSESIHRFITAGYAVSIDFTKQGRRQFAKVNRSLGRRYIRAFILKCDLAEYIAAHEAAGVHLDTSISASKRLNPCAPPAPIR